MSNKNDIVILMADDNEDDQLMARDAFETNRLHNVLYFVKDGIELMDYLRRQGNFSDPSTSPRPGLILLDLNMPLMDGREALKEIKSDPELHSIPVVVLTTSSAEEDIIKTYEYGVNSFITKPVTFQGLVEVIKQTGIYWFEIVELPDKT
ncbi:MAG: response regulator [Proteobacteria bacterium]|nr:response regulator [Pseudomonadota bacterium]MCH8976505.1 response regulator [Pseudomonadota bacterium]